ncbi:MAG: hypothetical protein H0W64_11460 [Gammaproteobacteria bacterium]|nr:hypothetical protein [Gammaproteobacteria bacterium]
MLRKNSDDFSTDDFIAVIKQKRNAKQIQSFVQENANNIYALSASEQTHLIDALITHHQLRALRIMCASVKDCVLHAFIKKYSLAKNEIEERRLKLFQDALAIRDPGITLFTQAIADKQWDALALLIQDDNVGRAFSQQNRDFQKKYLDRLLNDSIKSIKIKFEAFYIKWVDSTLLKDLLENEMKKTDGHKVKLNRTILKNSLAAKTKQNNNDDNQNNNNCNNNNQKHHTDSINDSGVNEDKQKRLKRKRSAESTSQDELEDLLSDNLKNIQGKLDQNPSLLKAISKDQVFQEKFIFKCLTHTHLTLLRNVQRHLSNEAFERVLERRNKTRAEIKQEMKDNASKPEHLQKLEIKMMNLEVNISKLEDIMKDCPIRKPSNVNNNNQGQATENINNTKSKVNNNPGSKPTSGPRTTNRKGLENLVIEKNDMNIRSKRDHNSSLTIDSTSSDERLEKLKKTENNLDTTIQQLEIIVRDRRIINNTIDAELTNNQNANFSNQKCEDNNLSSPFGLFYHQPIIPPVNASGLHQALNVADAKGDNAELYSLQFNQSSALEKEEDNSKENITEEVNSSNEDPEYFNTNMFFTNSESDEEDNLGNSSTYRLNSFGK